MVLFFQQIVNGLAVGSIYALIALGYTMVYGILELINFAHGEIYMVGAYLGIIVLTFLTVNGFAGEHLPVALFLAFLIPMLLCGVYGVAMEKIAYKPLRHSNRLVPLISALGVSIFLQNFVMMTQGPYNKAFPQILPTESLSLSGINISYIQLFIIVSSFVLMYSLNYLIKNTKIGMAMRATAQDKIMAQLVGININRVISFTFFTGSFLAASAGVMIAMHYGTANFSMGYMAGMKAFTAAVLGGIGNIHGAMAGGLILGIVEALGSGYISSEYRDVFSFGVLILILLLRPSGLFGSNQGEKV